LARREKRALLIDGWRMDVLRATLVSGAETQRGRIERVGPLTPYTLQLLLEEAMCVGAGAKLELGVPAESDERLLETTRQKFARLAARGVEVTVMREPHRDS
jgi:hypothetical protein